MFGISFEHLLIVGVILIFVGPKRLPELGNTMGKAIKNFKDSFGGIEEASFKRLITPESEKVATPSQTAQSSQTANASQAAPEQAATEQAPYAPSPIAPGSQNFAPNLASGGVSVPANSPIASAAPLAAGTNSTGDPASSDPHKS